IGSDAWARPQVRRGSRGEGVEAPRRSCAGTADGSPHLTRLAPIAEDCSGAASRAYDRPMSAVLETSRPLLPSRFAWLMGLHAENYHRLARLFAPQRLAPGAYVSCLDDGLDLRLDVLERHRYTLDLHLTYCFVDSETGESAPSALLRMYHDAHMAEVL